RACLLRLQARRQRLLLSLHHIACDAWSLALLLGELGEFYAAQVNGRAAAVAPVRWHYGDYAQWQREQASRPAFAASLGYWSEQLRGAPEELILGLGHASSAKVSAAGATVSVAGAKASDAGARLQRRLRGEVVAQLK